MLQEGTCWNECFCHVLYRWGIQATHLLMEIKYAQLLKVIQRLGKIQVERAIKSDCYTTEDRIWRNHKAQNNLLGLRHFIEAQYQNFHFHVMAELCDSKRAYIPHWESGTGQLFWVLRSIRAYFHAQGFGARGSNPTKHLHINEENRTSLSRRSSPCKVSQNLLQHCLQVHPVVCIQSSDTNQKLCIGAECALLSGA